ncbi:Vacuolar protein sorting-associated protein 4, partial [Coemansia sp. RSA 371]
MSGPNFLNNAIEIIKQAIAEDTAGNYEQAYTHYKNAIEYFFVAIKYDKNERQRESIRRRLVEYIDRAEQLKGHITKPQEKRAEAAAENTSNGAKSKGKDDGD